MGEIVSGRKVTLEEIKQLAVDSQEALWQAAQSVGRDVKLYLHWSAGHYHQIYDDYHIGIDEDGSIYVTTDDLSEVLAHTYRRNTGAIGISLACAAFCTSSDLGQEPPTDAQIESIAQVIAVMANTLDLNIDINHVMTHGEAADNEDGMNPNYEDNGYPDGMYGPKHSCERWDLAILHTGDDWCSGGDILRGKAIWYQQNGVN